MHPNQNTAGWRMINLDALRALEKIKPGSVIVDDKSKTVTLIGWNLEQFNHANRDHCYAQDIHEDAKEVRASKVSAESADDAAKIIEVEPGLQRVINPLTDTPQSAPERNQCSCGCRVGRKNPRPVDQKHKEPASYEDFIPVIKRKIGDRVFHVLSRLIFWQR